MSRMRRPQLYVGLDYHQQQLQVCVMDESARVRMNRGIDNDVEEVAGQLRSLGPVHAVAIEACCGAADFGQKLATAGPWRVELAHPGYVARLKQSPDKSDYSDARLLADLTRVGYLPRVWLAPQEIRDLRQLVNHRVRQVERRRALKLQIGALLREQRLKIEGSRWTQAWRMRLRDNQALTPQSRWVMNDLLEELAYVCGKILMVEARLREVTADDAVVAKLRRIEGVGEVTSWMLRAWVGRFDRFRTGKQLSRYCGLSPRNASSGERMADGGLIDAANRPLRAVLIQAAHRLIRNSRRWEQLAMSLQRRGKPSGVIVAAIANRWVRSIHYRMIHQDLEESKELEQSEESISDEK